MANEIVKYSNDVQTVALTQLTPLEARVFFALIHRLRDKGLKEVEFTWQELRELAHIRSNRDSERFAKTLEGIFKKIITMAICIEKPDGWILFTLFSEFEVWRESQTLRCKIHERFEYVLNNIDQNFIRFELPQFLKLRSKYAQALFRHLKQYRDTGLWRVDIKDFRRLFSVPKSYPVKEVTKRVIEPAVRECKQFFGGTINWHYLKAKGAGSRGQGGRVIGVEFTFQIQAEFFADWCNPLPAEAQSVDASQSAPRLDTASPDYWDSVLSDDV